MLKKIYLVLCDIRKELQAIRSSKEFPALELRINEREIAKAALKATRDT